ncbi:MAG: TIGR03936 family radical SAM-associated protein [Dehalococcoidia bacterium]
MTHRLRVTYRKQGAARYVAHLDLMRTWERAIRRAHLPLTYSQGFTPHPKLQLAAPLPVGTASEGELIDVWLDEPVTPEEMRTRLSRQLPGGLEIVNVTLVDDRAPSLQAASIAAHYEVRYHADEIDEAALCADLARFLALEALPWEEARGDRVRAFDLRAAVLEASVRREGDQLVLAARLSLRGGGSARPSSLARALGLGEVEPLITTRVSLELGEPGAVDGDLESDTGDTSGDELEAERA